MKSIECNTSVKNNTVTQCPDARKNAKKAKQLQAELAKLDDYDNDLKNRMQDRMKFMSGKNARRSDMTLNQVAKQRAVITAEIERLQSLS